jgi:ketol-acid reductoisomerase
MTMGQESKGATRVAVIGYGPRAREHALRLRDTGWDVSVVVRPGGMSWIRAMADGLRPVLAPDAVSKADVVAVHLPEAEQGAMWAQGIAPHVAPGALIVFAQGAALYSGVLEPDKRFDVVLVAPGDTPDACRVAVHQDATGHALERAASYARAVFAGAKVGTTTLASEVQTELSELVEKVGGLPALLAEWDRVLANPSHEPDEATLLYYERLRAAVLADTPMPISKPPSSTVRLPRKRGAA